MKGNDITVRGVAFSGALGGLSGWIGGNGVFNGNTDKKLLDTMSTASLAKMLGLQSEQEISKQRMVELLTKATVTNTLRTAFGTLVSSITSNSLKVGSTGNDVKSLQAILGVKTDGSFGPATQKALIALQKKLGITSDGKFGPQTRKAILNAATNH